MTRLTALQKPLISAILALAILGPSCTQDPSKTTLTPAPGVTLRLQTPIFAFQPSEITELTLRRNDPQRDDRWTVQLKRDAAQKWEIVSAPDGMLLADRRANTAFLDHWLTTLTTLVWTEQGPQGNLETLGLTSPHYVIAMKGQDRDLELRLGALLKDGVQRHAQVKGYAPSIVVRGSALKMIDFLESFETIRLPTILALDADSPDEIEIFENGRELLYAQRHNDDWADRKLKPARYPLQDYLEYLTHLRMRRTIDDATKVQEIRQALERKTTWRIVLRDRQGRSTELRAAKLARGPAYASTTERPGVVFELYDESLPRFRPARARPE